MRVVILPGLDGTQALRSAFCDQMSEIHPTETISYPPDLARYDDLLAWIVPRLPDEDYILLGESFSGPLAISVAASHPAHLKGVVFAATFAKSPRRVPKSLSSLLKVAPMRSKLAAYLLMPVVMGAWSTRAFGASFHEILRGLSRRAMVARLRQVLEVDLRSDVAKIAVPYLYVAASADLLVPLRAAKEFQTPQGGFATLDGPHFILQANPEDAVQAVAEFIAELPS